MASSAGLNDQTADKSAQPSAWGDAFETLDIRRLLAIIWRRKWILVASIAIALCAGFIYLSQTKPAYTATSRLMWNFDQSNVSVAPALVPGFPAVPFVLLSQGEIIQSEQLIGRVVDKLKLYNDPEFNPQLAEPKWYDSYLGSIKSLFGGSSAPRTAPQADETLGTPGTMSESLGAAGSPLVIDSNLDQQAAAGDEEEPLLTPSLKSKPAIDERVRRRAIYALMGRISVILDQKNFVMRVSVTSANPKKAATIANAISEQYLTDQLEAKFDSTQRATAWLTERLQTLKVAVEESEKEVEQYRSSMSKSTGQGSDLTSQQLTQLNAELIAARTERAEAEAVYNEAENILNTTRDFSKVAINSPSIEVGRRELSSLKQQEAELLSRYGERHPRIVNLRAEIAEAQNRITYEIQSYVQELKQKRDIALAREQTLNASLRSMERQSLQQDQASIRLRQLEREAEANRAVYQAFLSRFTETRDQEDLHQSDARIIAKATAPGTPSYPDKQMVLLICAGVGIVIGAGLVFVLEQLDNTFHTREQVLAETGTPCIGMIPLAESAKRRGDVLSAVVDNPSSVLAESIRGIRTSLLATDVDNPGQVTLVSSALPSEGKSVAALLLSEICTGTAGSVLLIDADLRRPTLHDALNVSNDIGLFEILTGANTLDEAIIKSPKAHFDAIVASTTDVNAADLVSSQAFKDFLQTVRSRYDVVVIDSPPTQAVSDAIIMSPLVDRVLFVARWKHTARESVAAGLSQFTEHGTKVSGVVLSQVDVKRYARYSYGYGGYGGYYKYSNYYS